MSYKLEPILVLLLASQSCIYGETSSRPEITTNARVQLTDAESSGSTVTTGSMTRVSVPSNTSAAGQIATSGPDIPTESTEGAGTTIRYSTSTLELTQGMTTATVSNITNNTSGYDMITESITIASSNITDNSSSSSVGSTPAGSSTMPVTSTIIPSTAPPPTAPSPRPAVVTFKFEIQLEVNKTICDEALRNDTDKAQIEINLKEQLTKIYNGTAGFKQVMITQLICGSLIVSHELQVNPAPGIDYRESINKAVEQAPNASITIGDTNVMIEKDAITKQVNKVVSNVSRSCSNTFCDVGFYCQGALQCMSECNLDGGLCQSGGQCYHLEGYSPVCVCPTSATVNSYYKDGRCVTKVEYFTLTEILITSIAPAGFVLIVLVFVSMCCCYCREKDKSDREKEHAKHKTEELYDLTLPSKNENNYGVLHRSEYPGVNDGRQEMKERPTSQASDKLEAYESLDTIYRDAARRISVYTQPPPPPPIANGVDNKAYVADETKQNKQRKKSVYGEADQTEMLAGQYDNWSPNMHNLDFTNIQRMRMERPTYDRYSSPYMNMERTRRDSLKVHEQMSRF